MTTALPLLADWKAGDIACVYPGPWNGLHARTVVMLFLAQGNKSVKDEIVERSLVLVFRERIGESYRMVMVVLGLPLRCH